MGQWLDSDACLTLLYPYQKNILLGQGYEISCLGLEVSATTSQKQLQPNFCR